MSQTEAKTIANSFKWLHKNAISPNNRAYYEYEYNKKFEYNTHDFYQK